MYFFVDFAIEVHMMATAAYMSDRGEIKRTSENHLDQAIKINGQFPVLLVGS